MLPWLLLACAHTGGVRDRIEQNALLDAATQYWLAVRWNDPVTAGAWLTTAEGRRDLGQSISKPAVRVTDAQVVQVSLDPRGEGDRGGLALVRVEGFDPSGTRLFTELVEQRWVRLAGGWRVDESQATPNDGKPW